ncbi:MAG TPA: ATP-binding protein [Telmatospirillum sp.]|nr:ATP-binding protein [Telmatospirillum sp.]
MFDKLFDLDGLVPHGFCLMWRDELFWSLAISDAIISLSYLSISTAMALYLIKRKDVYLRWVAVAFALFILLCAASHATDVWTLWSPDYGYQVVVKAATAVVSVFTAIALWPLFPHALSLPSAAQMATVNAALLRENEDRKRAEAALRTTEMELRAANKELESFAYAVSHDLRAPLRAMTGFSEALIEDFGTQLDPGAQDYLREISHAGRHMAELIDGLLQLSRATRGSLTRERIDLSFLAKDIRLELEQGEPGRRVTWVIERGLSQWGDRRMIEIVLRNLLENAWKYTAGAAEPIIRVFAEDRDDRHFLSISDNGAGFDMAYADKLFQPFQRLHRHDEFPGIGIGLSTVFRIVQRHGGVILAEGAVGRGATFRFSLPEQCEGGFDHETGGENDSSGGRQSPG